MPQLSFWKTLSVQIVPLDLQEGFVTAMKFDDILLKIGEFGRYQRWVLFLATIAAVPTAFHLFAQVFLAGKLDHWCKVSSYTLSTLWPHTGATKDRRVR